MKVVTLAPMTWMNFHPQATTLVKPAAPATASARWPSGPEITMAKPKCLAVAWTRGALLYMPSLRRATQLVLDS